jgi:hypothetical protein
MSTIEKKLVSTGKYVSAEHLDALISNYKRERWIQNSERIGEEDTLGVWCTLDELEEFFQKARALGADGVNICFGVYGGKAHRPELEGKQTIAFVATRSNEDNDDTMMNTIPGTSINPFDADTLIYNYVAPELPFSKASGRKRLGVTIVTDKNNRMRVI